MANTIAIPIVMSGPVIDGVLSKEIEAPDSYRLGGRKWYASVDSLCVMAFPPRSEPKLMQETWGDKFYRFPYLIYISGEEGEPEIPVNVVAQTWNGMVSRDWQQMIEPGKKCFAGPLKVDREVRLIFKGFQQGFKQEEQRIQTRIQTRGFKQDVQEWQPLNVHHVVAVVHFTQP